jgi:uncharacterized protein (TIGR03086 family)
MPDSKDPRDLLRRALSQASNVIDGVRPDQLDRPTPCSQFDVRTLVGHMIFAAGRIVQAGRRDEITTGTPVVSGLADDELAPAFAKLAGEAVAAWDAPDALDGDIALPFGTFPATAVVAIYVIEHVTHAWDLAVATGNAVELDDALATAALSFATEMVPAEFRGGDDMPFGHVVEVPSDAPVYDRLAGFLGREPARVVAR